MSTPNSIVLNSADNSEISGISLYAQRAEITRLFRISVKSGFNYVYISGLPTILEEQSVRVEGRGSATIHDVTISKTQRQFQAKSQVVKDLEFQKLRVEKALARTDKANKSLKAYIGTLDTSHVDGPSMQTIIENYESTAEHLDDKASALERELRGIDDAIDTAQAAAGKDHHNDLRTKVSVGIHASAEAEVKLVVIYSVPQANWQPAYDVRVDMGSKETPITLVYKASIAQSTGEDWTNAPLTLETAAPSFGAVLPSLTPWTVKVYEAPRSQGGGAGTIHYKKRSRRQFLDVEAVSSEDEEDYDEEMEIEEDEMQHASADLASKGNINATFSIPGRVTIPSDGGFHKFTIVELRLDALMTWVSIPKHDTRTYLTASITNSSDYTFVKGNASIYVDGSFVARTQLPLVSPQESFSCPLGIDPSLRITYHPAVTKSSETGFYTKQSVVSSTQRISIQNTKSTPVERLKIVDQVPVSQASEITLKLVHPNLPLPTATTAGLADTSKSTTTPASSALAARVQVQNGVFAMWDGAENGEVSPDDLGKDGKLCWICNVPGQTKLGLTLQWELAAPLKTVVDGL